MTRQNDGTEHIAKALVAITILAIRLGVWVGGGLIGRTVRAYQDYGDRAGMRLISLLVGIALLATVLLGLGGWSALALLVGVGSLLTWMAVAIVLVAVYDFHERRAAQALARQSLQDLLADGLTWPEETSQRMRE
ncbi:MAG: hypothetical protein AB7R89_03505 [Dehalococcoidia bacterium]